MCEFLCSSPLQTDRDQIADALQHRIGHGGALKSKTRYGLGSKPNSDDGTRMLWVRKGCPLQGCFTQLAIHSLEVDRTRTINLTRTRFVQCDRLQFEGL